MLHTVAVCFCFYDYNIYKFFFAFNCSMKMSFHAFLLIFLFCFSFANKNITLRIRQTTYLILNPRTHWFKHTNKKWCHYLFVLCCGYNVMKIYNKYIYLQIFLLQLYKTYHEKICKVIADVFTLHGFIILLILLMWSRIF